MTSSGDAGHRVAGTIGWLDLTTLDVDAARVFYTNLFGWDVKEIDTPFGPYIVCSVAGGAAGGIMHEAPEHAAAGLRPSWTTFFRVDALDATVAAIDEHGGKLAIPPTDLRGNVRSAVAIDPTGAEFGLLQAPTRVGLHIRTDPGAPCWSEVLTRDVTTTQEFYTSIFGWRATTDPVGQTRYTTFTKGRLHVAGMLPMPPMLPAEAPSHWLPYFDVANCPQAVDTALRLGGTIEFAPMTVGPGTFAILADPLGAVFAVFAASPAGHA